MSQFINLTSAMQFLACHYAHDPRDVPYGLAFVPDIPPPKEKVSCIHETCPKVPETEDFSNLNPFSSHILALIRAMRTGRANPKPSHISTEITELSRPPGKLSTYHSRSPSSSSSSSSVSCPFGTHIRYENPCHSKRKDHTRIRSLTTATPLCGLPVIQPNLHSIILSRKQRKQGAKESSFPKWNTPAPFLGRMRLRDVETPSRRPS